MTLAELRVLLETATPGPWKFEAGEIRPADSRKGYIASARIGPYGERYIHMEPADAALVVALRNAAPVLLEIAEAAVAYRDGLHPTERQWSIGNQGALFAAVAKLEEFK